MTIVTILLLACVTFGTRYLFLIKRLPIRLSPDLRLMLSFSGPGVLAAILAPILLVRNDQLQLTISNPYLWGAVAAIVAAWKSGNIYWTVGIGMLVFIGAGQLF